MSNYYLCDICAYGICSNISSVCKCLVKDMDVRKIIRHSSDKRPPQKVCKDFEVALK